MIPLKQISVPNPCPARWDAMEGGAEKRFCTGCQKNVYNLSEMSRREGEDLLTRTDAKVCVFFHPDAGGAPLAREDVPADIPLATRPRPSVWRRAWAAALSGLAAVTLTALGGGAQAAPHKKAANVPSAKPNVQQMMGGMVARLAPPKVTKPPKHAPLGGKPAVPHPPHIVPQPTGGVPMPPPPHPKPHPTPTPHTPPKPTPPGF
ncbi:MAG: hypothetical protein M3Y28_02085 [Armatimonadota bacterium]|nr:hypothetical protein [Armatimonadota bacterium]